MPNEHKAGIDRLEKTITACCDALAQLGRVQDMQELVMIIRRPGWTTPAELAFAQGMADGLLAHAQVLGQLKSVLVKAGGAVVSR